MKRAASFLLIFVFVTSAAPQASAQKTRSRSITTLKSDVKAEPTESQIASIGAFTDGRSVSVRWEMVAESRNMGFYVYRITSTGEEMATTEMIPGAALTTGPIVQYGENYSFFAPNDPGNAAYVVEMVSVSGGRTRSTVVSPTYTTNLNTIAGTSVQKLEKETKSATGEVIHRDVALTKELSSEVAAGRSAALPDVHRWVISRPGVKIGVRVEGIYRVTRTELQTAGFDVASDPANWQLYLAGVEQAITVAPNGAYIEFYGIGIDTVESDTNLYYLTVGDGGGKRIATRTTRPSTSSVNSPNYRESFLKKERTIYVDQILNGDAENYFGRIVNASGSTLNFDITGVDTSSNLATLMVDFQGFNFDSHNVDLTLNGHVLAPAAGEGRSQFAITQTVPTSWLIEGTNALQMRASGAAGDTNLFDNLRLDYVRTFRAQQNTLKFATQNYKTAIVDGFTSPNIRIYDLTSSDNPVLMTDIPIRDRGTSFGPDMPSGRGRLFYAIEESTLKTAFSITPNDPNLLSVPTNAADLVIIAHKNFLTQAEDWANYRRGQGYAVKVVNVEEIYDEFNFGVLSSQSITDFLKYAKNNWQVPPRYVLLIGDASYDSRNYQGTGYFNMVPTKFVTTIFLETGSDEGMADFDGDGLSEMAIGRIAVRTSQSVTDILNREIAWEANLNVPLDRGALFANDSNNGYDFAAMSQRLRDRLPSTMPVTMISRDSPTSHADVITSINSGKFLVNYVGHGSTGAWAATSFFSVLDVPSLTNANSPSIFTMLTCLNGYFVNLTSDSFAESLAKATNGGAVAVWASAGLTTPDVQEIMAARFLTKLADGDIPKMGDLVRDAKSAIPGGSDVRLSWALIGDPMLKVR
ncbi:MAG: C25 family cysteine peptidase [Pyrinomonadaceae bacterium]